MTISARVIPLLYHIISCYIVEKFLVFLTHLLDALTTRIMKFLRVFVGDIVHAGSIAVIFIAIIIFFTIPVPFVFS